MDLHTLERDPLVVAARLAASDLFSLLQRSVRLPPAFGGLAIGEDGATHWIAAGGLVDAKQARELIVVRITPIELMYDDLRVESEEGHVCEARLALSVQVTPDRSEYEAFCRTILGSSRRAEPARLMLHLRDAVEKAVHDFAATHPTAGLLHSQSDEAFSQALGEQLKHVLFTAGLTLGRNIRFEIRSPDWEEAQQRQKLDAAERQRLATEQRRRDAAGEARLKHVEQLSALLGRLDELAKERPGVSTADLIRTFDTGERAELYRQLLSREVSSQRTEAVAVVAGSELVLFNPNDGSVKLRRAFEGPLGPLRSVRRTRHDGVEGLLLGAARGVHHFVPMSGRVTSYGFDPSGKLRGGVNAAVILDGILYATHSEVGVLRWETDSPRPGRVILAEHTTNAASVRDIQTDECGALWFTADDRVIGWTPSTGSPAKSTLLPMATQPMDETGNAPPIPATGTLVSVGSIAGSGAPRIAALHVAGDTVFAGTSDGRLLAWPCRAPQQIETLLAGEGGGIESVEWISGLGVERLLVACRRPAAWLLVRRESCRVEYRCDEPLRWAAAADDWIIGVTDRRDRVHLWRPSRPEAVERTIWASRLIGHSIQDAAALPCDILAGRGGA